VTRGSDSLVAGIMAVFKSGLRAGHPLSALLLQRRRPPPPWRFDPLSALLGAMAAFFVAALIYRYRAKLRARWLAVRAGVERVRARLTSSLEDRYRAQVANVADARHLLARFAPLTVLYVPPPLITPPTAPTRLLTEEEGPTGEAARDRRRLQALLAEPRTLDLSSALRQYHRLAIMGPLGAGKSALLDYLATTFARQEATDNSGLDEDRLPLLLSLPDLDLYTAEEGRARKKKGRDREIRPIAGFLATQHRGFGRRALLGLVRRRLRAGGCCLLCDGLDEMEDEARQRAEAWLNELVQAYPDNRFMVVATPRSYDRLMAAGFVCFTLGEFTATEAEAFARRWQTARAESPLSESGENGEDAALPPTPWLPRRGNIRPLDLALRAVVWTEHNAIPTGRVPLLAQAFDYELKQMDDSPLSPDQWRAALGPLALTLHREGRHTATREEVETLIRQLFLAKEGDAVKEEPSQPTEATEETEKAAGVQAQADEQPEGEQPPAQPIEEQKPAEQEIDEKERKRREKELARQKKIEERERRKREKEAEKQRKREERQREEREREATKRARKALASLLRDTTLLVERDRDHLAFASPALRTYLAAWQLAQADNLQSGALRDEDSLLTAHVRDPRWQEVLALYAALAPVTPLVAARMQDEDDLFRSDLLAVAEYIALASRHEGRPPRHLRDGILGELAKVMMRPGQPLALRHSAAQALVRTGNKGVPLLFHRALTDADPHLRAVAAWGLGEWADEQDTKTISALIRALADPEWLVRAAALHALATIGGEAATDGLVEGLQHEDEFTRRVAAEALARLGATGYSLLKEAVELTDMHIRRAAVYGLGLVNEEWVFPLLDDLRRNDREWFVRSAVEEVFALREQAALSDFSPRPLPELSWLVRWAAERGLSVSSGAAAQQVLLQALAQDDWPVRLAAADTLRAQGGLWAVDALLQALADEDDLVREASFAALKEISWRSGEHISP